MEEMLFCVDSLKRMVACGVDGPCTHPFPPCRRGSLLGWDKKPSGAAMTSCSANHQANRGRDLRCAFPHAGVKGDGAMSAGFRIYGGTNEIFFFLKKKKKKKEGFLHVVTVTGGPSFSGLETTYAIGPHYLRSVLHRIQVRSEPCSGRPAYWFGARRRTTKQSSMMLVCQFPIKAENSISLHTARIVVRTDQPGEFTFRAS